MSEVRSHEGLLERLLAIGRALVAEAPLSEVLEQVMDSAIAMTNAERGFLCVVEPTGLQIVCARNLDREEVRNAQAKLSQSVVHRVVQSGQPLVSVDAPADPRLTSSTSIHNLAIRSVACLPLCLERPVDEKGRQGEPAAVGCIYVDHRFHAAQFEDADLPLLELFGAYAALALKAAELLERERATNAHLNTRLEESVSQLLETRHLLDETLADAADRPGIPGVVYASRAMHRIAGLLTRVAGEDLPILFTGESGTGKEMLARAVHALSGRAAGPFVAVNCGALPPDLFESELFGHVRGAFSGAHRDRTGLMESATGGSLFLDEVADLPLAQQVKLLRALQAGEIRRVGEDRTRRVDVRVLAATNKDLSEAIRAGGFREDLYYRLCVFHVHVPPLRDRPEDIPLLVDHLVERLTGTAKGAVVIEPEVYGLLANYDWPGNVRELQNEVRRALALGRERITARELSSAVFHAPRRVPSLASLQAAGSSLDDILAAVEREVIREALARHEGNKSRTAEALGISRNGLSLKMERLGLGTRG